LLQTLCVSNQCRGGQFRNHPECVQLREEERLRDERLRNGGNG
jgi:hypothetical protein